MTRQLTASQIEALERRHRDERDRIREGTVTLLAECATKPTIEDLRIASGLVERWQLTTRHIDLKDEFLRGVRERWGADAPAMVGLQRRYKELHEKYSRLLARTTELEETVATYAAVIEELDREANQPNEAMHRLGMRSRAAPLRTVD